MRALKQIQNRVLVRIIVAGCVFGVVWFFVYIPQRTVMMSIHKSLADVKNEINVVEGLVDDSFTMYQWITLLKRKNIEAKEKLKIKQEEALAALSRLAGQSGLQIVKMQNDPLSSSGSVSFKSLRIDGKPVEAMFMKISLSGSYEQLLSYMETLKESMPAYYIVHNLDVARGRAADLNITLKISLLFSG